MRGYTQRCPDCLNYLIHIPFNRIIRKTDYPVTKSFKRLLPFPILRLPAYVHTAIDLDDQTPAPTAKIDHVWIDRFLSIEFIAIQLAISQYAPQRLFSPDRLFSELSREVNG